MTMWGVWDTMKQQFLDMSLQVYSESDAKGSADYFNKKENAPGRFIASPMTITADYIRSIGWSVAVHNDYRLDGVFHTFWLFTKGDLCAKGEGRTDDEALELVVNEIQRINKRHPL